MTSVKLDSFIHGFTGAGLFAKLSPPDKPDEYRTVVTFLLLGATTVLLTMAGIGYFTVHGNQKLGYFFLGV